jgi:hypothetical protein
MASISHRFSNLLSLIFVAGAAGCSSGELLLPEPPGGGENVALSKFHGDSQLGTVGELLPEPLIVSVRTARDLPAKEREVEFVTIAGDVEIARNIAITDSKGNATIRCMLGTIPGDYVIRASLTDLEGEAKVQEFLAQARPGAPDTLSATSPVSQPEAVVAWQVTAGQGEVSEALTRTAPDGSATVGWTLGNRIGVHKLTAAVEQPTVAPVTFTVTVLF